jgi:site-specific DNA-cytosine methylase
MAALSLFSGCGGDTLGMHNAGLDVKWYSEKIPARLIQLAVLEGF